MELVDILHISLGDSQRREWMTEGYEVNQLRELIHYYQYTIEPSRAREALHEVKGHHCPS
jgi:hypothetical protein